MKPLAFAVVFVAAAPFAACSGDDVAPTVVTPGAGTSSVGSGGTTGGTTAGTPGTTGGTGGTTGGTGGSGATGGTGGTAGSGTQTGGSAGVPTTGGSAGGPPAGAGTGNLGGMGAVSSGGMSAGGAGGTAGMGSGGMLSESGGMGGMTSGGMSGSAGTGTASCPTIPELFPAAGNLDSLDGRLVTTPCQPTNSDDCGAGGWIYKGTNTACMGALTAQQDFTVGGTPGEMYQVTMHFYGVVEPKFYGNMATRESGNTRPTHMATGASPAPFATANAGVSFPASDYNTYEIHVMDNMNQEIKQYFLNSDTTEGHWTYLLNYERTIPVVGGGKVRVRTYDQNCRMIKNCGDRSGGVSASVCGSATKQTVDVSAAMPAPTTLMQPGLGQAAGESGQWLLIDVTKVECE